MRIILDGALIAEGIASHGVDLGETTTRPSRHYEWTCLLRKCHEKQHHTRAWQLEAVDDHLEHRNRYPL